MSGITRARLNPHAPVIDTSDVYLLSRRASLEDVTNHFRSRLPFLPARGIYLPPDNLPSHAPSTRAPSTKARSKHGYAPSVVSPEDWVYQPGTKQASAPTPEEIADAETYLRWTDDEHGAILAHKEAAETKSIAASTRTVGSRKLVKKPKSMKTQPPPPVPIIPAATVQMPRKQQETEAKTLEMETKGTKDAKAASGQTRIIPRMFRAVRLPFRGGSHRKSKSGPVDTKLSPGTPSTSHNTSTSIADIVRQAPTSGIAVAGAPGPKVEQAPKSYIASLFTVKRRATLESQKHAATPNSKYAFSFKSKHKKKAKVPTATAALTSSARAIEHKARVRLRRSVSFSGYASLSGFNAILSMDSAAEPGELDELTQEAEEINLGLMIPTLRNKRCLPRYREEDNPVATGFIFERSVANSEGV